MSKLLWTVGALLVALGLAAQMLGWDALLWLPMAALDIARSNPETYGLVLLGIVLMVLARLLARRRG